MEQDPGYKVSTQGQAVPLGQETLGHSFSERQGPQERMCRGLSEPYASSDSKDCLKCRRPKFHSWVRKIPWRRGWQPTPVFFPGDSRGQRSLVGYSPWGCKQSDTTE